MATEVFIISVLWILILVAQIIVNGYFEWKRKKEESKKLEFERQKHIEQLKLEKEKYRLEKKQLRQEKYRNFLDYQNRINEMSIQYLSTMILIAEKFGVDLSKGDLEGQVQTVLKKVTQPQKKERLKTTKEQLKSRRKPKK